MKEEDNLRKKLGTKEGFSVPDNYFENLTSRIMTQLPEKESLPEVNEPSKWQKINPFAYMAAMFIGAALIIKVASIDLGSSTVNQIEGVEVSDADEQYISEVINGSMLDDYSLYVYLTESESEN